MTVDTTRMHGQRVLEPYINAYRFEALTGLRPGEVIAARWDWLKDSTLYIRGAINQWAEHTQGKNDNARRVYRLPVLAQEVLDGQRRLLEAQAIRSPYIFPNEIGMPILQATYYSRWVRYRDSNGLTQGTTPYGLRHTFFSACKPIPKPLLDPVAGHSPAMDTFGVYGHEMDGDLQYVADEIDGIFSRILASEQDVAPKMAPE